MIGNIINTVGSRLGISLIGFLLLIMNSRYIGASGLGTVGLIILSITIVLLFCNLLNTSLVYFAQRKSTANLLFLSYAWTFVSLLICFGINQLFPLFPQEYIFYIYLLSFLQSGMVIHLNILIGHERIKTYNFSSLLQSVISILLLSYFYFIKEEFEIISFIHSLLISYIAVFLLSFFQAFRFINGFKLSCLISDFKEVVSYGFFVQSANVFQLLNYRISYYILDFYSGRASLGIYTAGVQISEALLLPGKSISTVQYARISSRKNEDYGQRITLLFMKISLLITSIGTLVLLALPTRLFTYILGEDFTHIKVTIFAMALGIVSLSGEMILSHYFSATGRQKKNSSSSLIGLVFTIILAFVLIPQYGAIGAALTSSIAFSAMFVYLIFHMKKHTGMSEKMFLPNKQDVVLFRRLIRKFKSR